MKKFLQELCQNQESYVLYCDSQSAIHLRNNSTYNQGQTHRCEVMWCVRERLLQKEKNTDDKGTNMMTKTLPNEKVCKEYESYTATPN